jgi:hypothetical protein
VAVPASGDEVDMDDEFDLCPRCGAEMNYDDDPLWYDPGDMEQCRECGGAGRIRWCSVCGYDPITDREPDSAGMEEQ